MKQSIWKKDWMAGLIVVLLVLIFSQSAFIQSLERSAYDWGVNLASSDVNNKVAVIAIDDESIANLGRWPWSRDLHADMIQVLQQGEAKVIGYTVMFLEPQEDPGLIYIQDLIHYYNNSTIQSIPQRLEESPLRTKLESDLSGLEKRLSTAKQALETDKILANVLQESGNVVLAMPFVLGQPIGNPDSELPNYVQKNTLNSITDNIGASARGETPIPASSVFPPIEELGMHASAIGHLNLLPDVDGAIRNEPLVIDYYNNLYPSFSLMVAAKSLNLDAKDITVQLGEGLKLDNLSIATGSDLLMNTFFYSNVNARSAFTIDSFYDVITGKIPVEKYKNKIVLIGSTAIGVGNTQVTPVDANMAPVLTAAHTVSSILNEDFFISPAWSIWVQLGVFVFIALYLMFLVPLFKANTAAIFTVILLLIIIGGQVFIMSSQLLWIGLMTSAFLLTVGHITITTKRFFATEKGKMRSDSESAQSNKMLGLSFQNQGQLDTAFEKFRKVPMDNDMMETLYNLALDYERKRQFNKAVNVYDYMGNYDKKFRDIESRMGRSKTLEETVILGGGGSHSGGETMVLDGSGIEKPMLGRYEIEKELGKGAMGIVYQGKDPKISRVVAIKTMALSQEFEEDELEDVKKRFFREAESAGRLNHPSIVTIFDAGEEHDLAYIAMEYLKGKDLAEHTKPDNLLPFEKVLDIVAHCAEGLAYAHQFNIVHRDIKPANIMYDPDGDSAKITDFGIARITDASKTKTGMILGTPSYMSPEQLSGEKVDGRSDLFSLGVMLYQMILGRLPFKADSMAALMYQIANEQHPDPLQLKPDLTPCIAAIINKALEKDIDLRYQDGNVFSRDIRACIEKMRQQG